ncbi:MAG: FAD-dependent oxidoreductase [Rhodocyclaceae bacterium]|nr:FAD-dependent oxidoreductase [Rhodocyclaceae bacterium]MBX3669503.1 FAD-dependent oxidoreductase [Rhodocyclaceae bacterium]
MQISTSHSNIQQQSSGSNWMPHFPNPADFRFNYYQLLLNAPHGLARLPAGERKSVAVIGAGAAGMTAARELLRCGFSVSIYEASNRIGGRLHTHPNPNGHDKSGMELGAMRMPFFPKPGAENCVLEYYICKEPGQHHSAKLAQFPNPGSAPGNTGVYMNQGLGPDSAFKNPQFINWPYGKAIDNRDLASIAAKVNTFVGNFQKLAAKYYTSPVRGSADSWEAVWDKLVNFYDAMTFDDLVMAKGKTLEQMQDAIAHPITLPDGAPAIDWGGFDMDSRQAGLLYTIGTGDGSWGAFYAIGALWFIRCTMFGFGGSELQTVAGLTQAERLPCYGKTVTDSLGNDIPSPRYAGMQSLVEYLYFVCPPGADASLHDSVNARLFTQTRVTEIIREPNGRITVVVGGESRTSYDYVFISCTKWAAQASFALSGFTLEQLPQAMITAQHTQHNIASCKVFYPLKTQYWKHPDNKIPQMIVTDTDIQDCYSLAWDDGEQNGVILASYTWEDDSLKLLASDPEELAGTVLKQLRKITTDTVGQDITQHIDKNKAVTWQWSLQKSYRGCALLYRERNKGLNNANLHYNQNRALHSNLYFVGENYSVEGGWTEPALRSALDGVMNLLHNVGAKFTVAGFDYARDYPRWSDASGGCASEQSDMRSLDQVLVSVKTLATDDAA